MGEMSKMRKYFDTKEKLREQVLNLSRRIIRASSRAIAAMHRADQVTVKKMLNEAKSCLVDLEKKLKYDLVWMDSGIVQSAQQEYCEAKLLEGILKHNKLLASDELKIPYRPYLTGMGDVSGELRRHALDLIREDKVAEAEKILKRMEDIYNFIMSFDYSDAILPGIRRKQDLARGVLEKTRGDLTTALRQQRLEKALGRAKRGRGK